jgi:spore maturation protein CgeB
LNIDNRAQLGASHTSQNPCLVVFRTLPDHLNSNRLIEESLTSALNRLEPGARIVRPSIEVVSDAILETRPLLVIGIGSIAFDSIDYAIIRRAATRVGARLVYWLLEDPYEFDFNWKIQQLCDWIFTTDRASIDYYDNESVSHLPLAADVVRHFVETGSYNDRLVDVFFCGAAFPNRRSIISRLRHTLDKCNTMIRGVNWDDRLTFCKNDRIDPRRMAQYYASSKIALNIGRQLDIANARYEIVASTPGPRTFEAAAAGCVQAYFLDSSEIFEYYENKREIRVFNSVSEFDKLVEEMRDDPASFERISLAAQERTRASHTYDHRVKSMFAVLNKELQFNISRSLGLTE